MAHIHKVKSEKRMILSFVLNLAFTIFEFIGGFITGSIALLSDSVHDFGDSISIGVAIFLEKKSKQKPDYKYTYGYYRFSLLGGLISSVILIVGSTLIVYKAIERIINPEPLLRPELLIWFAVFGVVVNGIAAFNVSKGESINERVISLHLLEDVFGWIALLIAAIFINIYNIDILDVILSLVFSAYIVFHVIRNLKRILEVFLERAPKDPSIKTIKKVILDNSNVFDVHHIHFWTLEGSIPIITLHIVVDKNHSPKDINEIHNDINERLKKLGIEHTTIQVEFKGMDCFGNDCNKIDT
ncbi:MAG: cation diffusion facilitator family transporter [Bacillota bacterium]